LKAILSAVEYHYLDAFGEAGPGKQIKVSVSLAEPPGNLRGENSEVVPKQVLLGAPAGILEKRWA
jgi:hypothetical protein